MPDSHDQSLKALSNAEAKFAEFLRQKEAGETASFDEYCARHPEEENALRMLHSIYEEGKSSADPPSLVGKLERFFGATLVEKASLDSLVESPQAGPTGDGGKKLVTGASGSRYEEKGEIARGGMGIVFRIYDRDLNRQLAMKVLQSSQPSTRGAARPPPDQLSRFLEEAQVTAQLDHPGIVPVHELGVDAYGRVYFTMQLVKGRELREIFELARREKEGWSLPRAVGVIIKACQAVAYAHAKGVIHRDLKPSNVMVGRFGEVYVMDWGLAKIVGKKPRIDLRPKMDSAGPSLTTVHSSQRGDSEDADSPLVTMDGTIIGTPAYMALEQAAGRIEEVDHFSDIYSLGAILYALLAGHPPYIPPDVKISARTVLARVLDGPPTPLHKVNTTAPLELVAICDKAMARKKADRYSSALELAEDLQAYLDQRVVRAHRTGPIAELRKWVARNRGTAVAGAAALFVLFAGLGSVLWVQTKANRDILRLADIKRLKDFIEEAEQLWPSIPEKAGEMAAWIQKAEPLAARLQVHRDSLHNLEARGTRLESPGGWKFPALELEWQHETLEELVNGLEKFCDANPKVGVLASVLERLAFASSVRRKTIEEHSADWDLAIQSIANESECPQYHGLKIARQVGLVPLGRDPHSGLWEFAHLQSGNPAARGADGGLKLTPESGLVLVLLPGGTFRMGAQRPSPTNPKGSPNCDEYAQKLEAPVHDVTLEPFFASKFEMTQGQWQQFMGNNPSRRQAAPKFSLQNPVENVSLEQARTVAAHMDLELPTEAQWEYLARGGTSSVWWTGDDPKRLAGAANLADATFDRETSGRFKEVEEWLDDGYACHAPVGSFRANAFGLHDTVGNVWEWVRDYGPSYGEAPRKGDGLRGPPVVRMGLLRGGGWNTVAVPARSANRYPYAVTNRADDTGLRPVRAVRVQP